MNTYAIRRKNAWRSPEEVEAVAKRAKEVADDHFQDQVRWIRSYVLAESDGSLGSVCIYQASTTRPFAGTPTASGCRPTKSSRSPTRSSSGPIRCPRQSPHDSRGGGRQVPSAAPPPAHLARLTRRRRPP